MDAVTYPHEKVIDFVVRNIVPLRVPADAQPLAGDFKVTWTPTLVTLDFYGKEHHRTVGFLPPEELIASLILGMAKTDFDFNQFNDAIIHFDRLLVEYPRSAAAPEAVYLRGVSRFKASHDARPLKEAYEKLRADYPASEWTQRAQPYSLL
ncbi:MAG TPA: outer membrane protein assembly factor BamD [Geobacteraceae bacterium]